MMSFTLVGLFVVASSVAFAGRRVVIYPDTESVSFTNTPGQGICRLSIKEVEPAEVLEETKTHLKVRFDRKDIIGCNLLGSSVQEGWLEKKEIAYGVDDPTPVKINERKPIKVYISGSSRPCPNKEALPAKVPELAQSREIEKKASGMGMKDTAEADRWMQCYPQNSLGLENYKKVSPFIDKIASDFSFSKGGRDYSVNPVLFKCLLRRESGYDPVSKSKTGAYGLGQQTNVNIHSINHRLSVKDSWERKLWDRFFDDAKKTNEGQKMLSECARSPSGKTPVFESKADAACPLQSLAASAIYNLQIQESLRSSAKVQKVGLKEEFDYQLAIGAAYNLGNMAASSAVSNLEIDGWIKAIKEKPKGEKTSEVANHIEALRNCMEDGTFKPMYKNDPRVKAPMCESPKKEGKS